MATIRYRVRGKQELSPIYLKFSNGRNSNFEIKSGYKCNPKYFNNKKGVVRDVAEFENKLNLSTDLELLKSDILKVLVKGENSSKDWLQYQVDLHHGLVEGRDSIPYLKDMIETFIEYKKYSDVSQVTQSTIKTYEITQFRIEKFEKYKEKNYLITEIGSDFKDEFVRWAKKIEKYAPETYKKTLKQLRTVCRHAKNKKKFVIDESLFIRETTITKKEEQIKEPYLNRLELKKLEQYKGSDSLENVRDWLLISCWTACRVGDLLNLSESDLFTSISGKKMIKYTQEKTGHKVTVPIHPVVQFILDKNDSFPRKISTQKYNDYLKDLCEELKFNELMEGEKFMNVEFGTETKKRKVKGIFPKFELITSHIGRKSFATNHYGVLPTHKVMQVTGHQEINVFLLYVKDSSEEHVQDFEDTWENYKIG